MKKPLIILTGPTAVGKTDLSIKLAKAVNGEIISADSMQVYKYMDIGTAKIAKEEMDGVKHYLVDEFEPEEDFNVVKFKEYSNLYMKEIYAKGKIPILVGGTGFYIQAVLNDVDFSEMEADTKYRKELEDLAQVKGNEYLHEMLREVDEKSAVSIHPNNVKRVIRALEYYKETKRPISEHNEEQKEKTSPYNFAYFVLTNERDTLYQRIDKRVDLMMEQGLLEEVKYLYQEKGYSKDLVSMQGLGYKEIIAYLDGECTLEEAVYILKRDTRHFAKRQLTWFRREKEVIEINKLDYNNDDNKILQIMLSILKERNINFSSNY
ncbi:tRNA (adenosine(37)-N6)-dimethylallyltransferase MiaA [Anaeromicropila herbilytica]|uniref:tRNA dimethylallyltransferase n=1 Tax=Anaeromicropila herbilytica TaxID=2785025 RepID=A0A7R7ID06_9FIRM|nr:tRNA (adenosine(37)-N6)-dimethylallyltransferase MiaA [Anaeromicropila herbilytica]BCN31293.1 tRNA dimethylallyltransferase [Anaeromicropila herbilytica]